MCDLAFGEEGDRDEYDGVVVSGDQSVYQRAAESLYSGCRPCEPYFGDSQYFHFLERW